MLAKINAKELAVDILYDIVGCFLFAVGVQSLSMPYSFPPGGVTGIAMLINHLFGLPISALTLIINIPLLILAVLKLGKRFAFNSIKTVIILSLMLELCARVIPPYIGEEMLAALFAGVLQGAGIGVIFLRGSTTGGTDILSKLVQLRHPHISIGRLILVIDVIILMLTAVVYGSVANAMYSLIIVFVATKIIDSIVYGLDNGRMLMVISSKHNEIAATIGAELGRGSTMLEGTGTYTGENRQILLCAVSSSEFHRVKRMVHSVDPSAFVVSLETDEVLGEGFKPLKD